MTVLAFFATAALFLVAGYLWGYDRGNQDGFDEAEWIYTFPGESDECGYLADPEDEGRLWDIEANCWVDRNEVEH